MILLSQAESLSFTEALTPFLPLIGIIVGSLIIGAYNSWNRRRGNHENRVPDVNEIWLQQTADNKALDIERKLRRWIEDRFYNLLRAFRAYVTRVQGGGSPELTEFETEMYGSEIPDDLTVTKEKKA